MGGSKTDYRFIFKGVEYDASDYVQKHPGGAEFIENMKAERKDFTEYFKSLHSEDAEKILKSFPIVARHQESPSAVEYYSILEKVKHLYAINWGLQAVLVAFNSALFLTGCLAQMRTLSIICFALMQVIVGWMAHSMAHTRCKPLIALGQVFSALTGGFSLTWWSPKHNMHHMFTNSELYDEDIKHEYKVYLYPFLYLKWRFDSFVAAFTLRNPVEAGCLLVHYAIMFYFRRNLFPFLIGQLLAGLFSAFVLVGNHERERRFGDKVELSFIEHQIIACRNYRNDGLFWLLLMGGMQYQAEHHMFPQIPFYNLPLAVPIIRAELAKINKSITYGPVL